MDARAVGDMDVRTVGVEEEFLLVRADLAELAPEGDEIVRLAASNEPQSSAGAESAPEPVSEPFEHEFKREQAELGTAPCDSLAELDRQLRELRGRLAHAARQRGAVLVASGTSPLPGGSTATEDDRYARMGRDFAVTAAQQLSCGMHVHVAIGSPEEGVAVLDRIRPWLAVLTALSANSPFWQGEDTGYASYRTQLWGQWPTAGAVEAFGDVAGYHRATGDLIASGAALDDGMIYFDARLSASYPTVEIRVADVCGAVADAVLIAGLIRGLVATAAAQWRVGLSAPPVRADLLRAAQWRAARWGMSGELVDVGAATLRPAWDLADLLVDWVATEISASGDLDRVRDGLRALRERGTGADAQRATLARSGRLVDVVRSGIVDDR